MEFCIKSGKSNLDYQVYGNSGDLLLSGNKTVVWKGNVILKSVYLKESDCLASLQIVIADYLSWKQVGERGLWLETLEI